MIQNKDTLQEAFKLSEEILRNIELGEVALTNIALKAVRLARLLNDSEVQQIMRYEASGYPTTPTGVPSDVFGLAQKANRGYKEKNVKTGNIDDYVYLESIEELEHNTKLVEISLKAAQDPDVSVSSANPSQTVWSPLGNAFERNKIREDTRIAAKRLSSRRTLIYDYVLTKHYELKYSDIADDIFSRVRQRVDSAIGETVPDAINKLSAIYDNLRSTNPEDWSNAAHGCRRVLQDLADAVYPAREDKVIQEGEKPKHIKLGTDQYINRLIAYIEEHSTSKTFQEIVGSHLSFIGDRLDSLFRISQKGSHSSILTREEADRCVIYTYLILGDILSL